MAEETDELEEVVGDAVNVLSGLLQYMLKEANRAVWVRKVLEIAENPTDMDQALKGILEVGIQEQQLGDSGSVFITLPAEGGEWELERLVKLTWANGIQRAVEAPSPPRKFTRKTGGLAWHVYESKRTISMPDCSKDKRFVSFADGGAMRSFIGVPIRYQGEVLAVMCLHSRDQTIEYSEPDVAFIEALARAASVTMIANHNDLTKLPNRLLMNYLLSREIAAAQEEQAELCLAYSDIDHFGQYNARYGYNGADELIRQMGNALRQEVGTDQILCHRHGDEFAVIFRRHSRTFAMTTMDKIRNKISTTSLNAPSRGGSEDEVNLNVSVGVVQLEEGQSANDLMDKAAQMLGKAKRWRDCVADEQGWLRDGSQLEEPIEKKECCQ